MAEGGASRIARHFLIDGRVQGVGFRWHTRLEARSLGLFGWVRNLDDGRVEAHVEGAPAAVEELSRWLERGPSGAFVEEIDAEEVPPEGLGAFQIT